LHANILYETTTILQKKTILLKPNKNTDLAFAEYENLRWQNSHTKVDPIVTQSFGDSLPYPYKYVLFCKFRQKV